MPSPQTQFHQTGERGFEIVNEQHQNIVILPANKGKAVVVVDADQYTAQATRRWNNLQPHGTSNRTKKTNGRIQRKLGAIKQTSHVDQATYNKIYPNSDATHRFYATPKILKDTLKMRQIVSGFNSITNPLARYLTDCSNL